MGAKWTLKQRAKFAATMREKRQLLTEGKKHVRREAQDSIHLIQEHVAYLYGRFENEIEHYARSNGISYSALAAGVASLFRHPKGR